MLPVHLSENIRKQVLYYLQSTFDFRDRAVDKAFERFLNDPDTGLFKGPWVQLRRPYRPADQDETPPFDFQIPFHPFKHQARAWRRLSSKDHKPLPTIVTTGTGSGKTECFLFPILDHCLRARRRNQKGVKAIVLYPMNALAADQEKRFARVIWNTDELKREGIRVGNYTGRYDPADPTASIDGGTKAMGSDHGITNHAAQQEDPPDILLTNYKMLDYLLLRPQDQALWRFNEPSTLQFLALDELHTYDGAQGADVACLIRRLKERFNISKGELCVIGASATLDDREPIRDRVGGADDDSVDARETSSDRLARFASALFEEEIQADAVIGEDRLTVEEILRPDLQDCSLPDSKECMPRDDEDSLFYALRQVKLWGGPEYGGPPIPPRLLSKEEDKLTDYEKVVVKDIERWSIDLGEWLKSQKLFKYLLDTFDRAEANKEGPVTWNRLVERLAREEFGFNEYPRYEDRDQICASFFALVAQAKERRSGIAFPMTPTQVQLWIRELRRLGKLVYEKPIFTWLDEPIREYPSLPTFHCSECGESGWIALRNPSEDSRIAAQGVIGFKLESDPAKIYRGWFGYKGRRNQYITVICPWPKEEVKPTEDEGRLFQDEGRLFQDEGKLFQDEGRLFRDEGKLFQDEERLFRDEGKLFQDEGRLFRDKGRLFRDEGELFQDEGRLFRDEGKLFRDEGRLFRDEGKLFQDEGKPIQEEDLQWKKQSELGFKKDFEKQPALIGQSAENEQTEFDFQNFYLCPKSLVIRQGDGPCPLTNDPKRFRVKANTERRKDESSGETLGDQGCPNCGSKESVFFIGSQSATLSSVAIDELFGSVLNDDPKLLAFTDSVQDASHRAGFFTARTYHFTFRTALQHVIDDVGGYGLRLSDAGSIMLDWWSQTRPGWSGEIREAMASLMPPDLHEYEDFLAYRNNSAANEPPKKLREDIERRLTWEATSEFSLMQTHGRTMETTGSACLGWDEARIAQTVNKLRERMPGIDHALIGLSERDLTLWIYGFLHRARIRGALDHPYLADFAANKFWGKYPYGRTIPGRETYPPSGHYKPHLMTTQFQRGNDHVLAPKKGGQSPWQLVWARRALKLPGADDTSLLDLINALLEAGTEAGLFKKLHQDGMKRLYAIASEAAMLFSDRVHFMCSQSERPLVRPSVEAKLWEGAPSLEYYADKGVYKAAEYSARQKYYQDRYRKGALRRVVAQEHTGLLATEEREDLEYAFAHSKHTDDPNVLTCTSTLEMGIDIGDLSSTMLCSIPPSTASYLQRIGRAGRATGTALIVSVVNQRPHDLFFYGRPVEMLRGKVDPPGCRLDASAVLVRQYLAYCFDSAAKNKEIAELPRTGRQLIEDIGKPEGNIPRMIEWATKNEIELRSRFLKRFQHNIQSDTRDRFISETAAELMRQRIEQAVSELDRMLRDLDNARKRLRDQLTKLDEEEKDAKQEIEQELQILQARISSLGRTNTLEILTDAGLLPNYAFPERGVRFYGAIYNKHRGIKQEHKPIEAIRPAGTALKELAPSNYFYTHRRRFNIQQIAIGNPQQPLIEQWAICGACGHMRRVEELSRPEAQPACPQCGHDRDADSQTDQGQHRQFIEFARSEALSQMEHYESLSSDRSEEREREFYQTISSFDMTREALSGAVGDERLPFGIEYRASVIMREANVGYQRDNGTVPFGADRFAPEDGFRVCKHCGIAAPPGSNTEQVNHRRSCQARRKLEKLKQEGRQGQPFEWESIYLYRELKSEAIRLLLPIADDADIDTLAACILLGLRLRFEGNPTYLIVASQILPDAATGMRRHYLVLLDGVPGGTGYLKSLYQEKDLLNREGEGIMQVLRLAKNMLETCICRQLRQDPERQDTDGCYRCIRTYHQQYRADRISRERGIALLSQLIEAGERRAPQRELESIRPNSLFDSMLEKKFVDVLRAFVQQKNGSWEQTIIRGKQGFRFSLPGYDRLWELELQPTLGLAQGVAVQSRPDFILRSDDDRIKPVAIFTDGFQFHCHPINRLADDMQKRRAIIESGKYYVWNISWNDLEATAADHNMICNHQVAQILHQFANAQKNQNKALPDSNSVIRNGLEQLKAFIIAPHAPGWSQLATFVAYFPLQLLAAQRTVGKSELRTSLNVWRTGAALPAVNPAENTEWVYNDRASLNQDLVTYITVGDAVSNRRNQTIILARLGDSEEEVTGSDYNERWRRFLACLNLYQFSENFRFWTSSETELGTAPEIPLQVSASIPDEWQAVLNSVLPSLNPYIQELAAAGLSGSEAIPQIEYFNEQIDDDAFAELAWPDISPPIAVLAGDQEDFAGLWQKQGWKIITLDDLQAKGISYLIDQIAKHDAGV